MMLVQAFKPLDTDTLNIQNLNTLFLLNSYFIARVYFAQEYIYHETAGRVVYIFLRKINE